MSEKKPDSDSRSICSLFRLKSRSREASHPRRWVSVPRRGAPS